MAWASRLSAVFCLALLVMMTRCSSGSSDSAPSGSCEAAHRARCKRACECQPGPECAYAPGVAKTDGGTTVFAGAVVKSEEGCYSLTAIECHNGGDPAGDYPVCQAKSPTSACVEFEAEGVKYIGVEPVAECNFH